MVTILFCRLAHLKHPGKNSSTQAPREQTKERTAFFMDMDKNIAVGNSGCNGNASFKDSAPGEGDNDCPAMPAENDKDNCNVLEEARLGTLLPALVHKLGAPSLWE